MASGSSRARPTWAGQLSPGKRWRSGHHTCSPAFRSALDTRAASGESEWEWLMKPASESTRNVLDDAADVNAPEP